MTAETEVVSCPACRQRLRVPLDWLGQRVQCPECQAMFKAPIKVDGGLTAPELITGTPVDGGAGGKRWDMMLLLPAFGLLLCGVMGVIVNGMMVGKLFLEQDGGKEWSKNQMEALSQGGIGTPGPPETQDQRIEQDAADLLRFYRWFMPLSLIESIIVFLGGLSLALRWNYWLAQLGCVVAMFNVGNACCVPGTVFAVWGLLMLNSQEGRAHFRRIR